MRELIDFDAQFNEYMDSWADKLLKKGKKPEEIEELIPDAYKNWADKASKYFDGLLPQELASMLGAYMDEEINVPDILLNKISSQPDCETAIYNMYLEDRPDADRIVLMNLLSDMGSLLPVNENIRLLCDSKSEELAEAAAEALKYSGTEAQKELLRIYNDERDIDVREKLIYVLVYSVPRVEGLAEKLVQLISVSENKAIIAGMMAFYGDDKCLDALKKAENADDINYIDYVEICDAIESLGGETTREREFNGDEYYEMMHNGGIEQ